MPANIQQDQLNEQVRQALYTQPVTDLHTHVFAPRFGSSPDPKGLMLWGIDELITYHYLIAEVFRVCPPEKMPFETFWKMDRKAQADHIWQHLFVNRTPISEACRGVITTLQKLGLDPNEKDLNAYRRWFGQQDPDAFVNKVMEIANVDAITMTNEVFDAHEYQLWLDHPELKDDPRFPAVLRIDKLLLDWPGVAAYLKPRGYELSEAISEQDVLVARKFLEDWIKRMQPKYLAVSLPSSFRYQTPESRITDRILNEIILPVCKHENMPFAMMIGVTRNVNPLLSMAGDMCGKSDIASTTRLLAAFPENKFMITMLARENQHELAVAARKFPNLMVFGCWWFLNNPSLITEITSMRLELLGTSFIPQHSDARILDQLIYKWEHTRALLVPILADKYAELITSGINITEEVIKRDVRLLLRDNTRDFWHQ